MVTGRVILPYPFRRTTVSTSTTPMPRATASGACRAMPKCLLRWILRFVNCARASCCPRECPLFFVAGSLVCSRGCRGVFLGEWKLRRHPITNNGVSMQPPARGFNLLSSPVRFMYVFSVPRNQIYSEKIRKKKPQLAQLALGLHRRLRRLLSISVSVVVFPRRRR